MMKATTVHYNHQTGIVTADPHPDGEKYTVTEDASSVELIAGDDVAVTVDGGISTFEALTPQPLLIREGKDAGTIEVLTSRRSKREDGRPAGAKA